MAYEFRISDWSSDVCSSDLPNVPDLPGLGSFAGAAFHSARWDHDVPVDGRRVGVIGTGSSAVQITGALVDRVSHLDLFQRTPQWIMPIDNTPYAEAQRRAFRDDPALMRPARDGPGPHGRASVRERGCKYVEIPE